MTDQTVDAEVVAQLEQCSRELAERKRAEETLRLRTEQLEALRQMGLEFTTQLDLDSLLRSIVSRAVELVGGNSGGLYLYRPERDVLEWAMTVGPHLAPIGTVLRRGEGLSGKVWESGEPLIVDDYHAWEGRAAIYEGYPFKAVVGVPVRWGEEFLGVLDVLADPPRTFSPADAELLSLFADQAAIAIENARLFAALSEERERLELLYDVARQAGGGLGLEETLTWLVERITTALGGQVGELFILEPESGRLRLRALTGVDASPAAMDERLGLRLGQGVVGWAALHRQVAVVPDVTKDERWLYVDELDRDIKSVISVPLLLGEETMGALSVLHPQVGYFDDPAYSHLLSAISRQVAMTIQNARLYEELKERMEEMSALYQVSKSLVSALDLDTLLKQILEAIRDSFGYSNGAILLLDERGTELHAKAASGYIERVEGIRIKVGKEGITGWVAQHGKMYYAPDVSADPHYIEPMKTEKPIRSEVALPLKVGPRLLGVLDVESVELDGFDERDFRVLSAIADQAAIAIENARLYEEAQQRVEELFNLNKASQVVASSLDAQDVLTKIVSLAGEVVNSAYTSVVLVEEDGELSTSVESFKDITPLHLRARPHGMTRRIINTSEPVIVNQVSDDGTHNPAIVAAGIESYAGVPIMTKGKVLGVLFVHGLNPYAFNDRIPLLTTFANQAAIAIENARLFNDLESSLEELKRAQAQLVQAEKLAAIGQLVAGVAHELNNPLTAVIGYAQLLQRKDLSQKVKEDLGKIHGQAVRCAKIVERLLAFARKQRPEKRYVDINDIIESTLELRAYQLKADNIEVVKELEEGLPMTMADPNQMQQVFLNIINNAHQAMFAYQGRGRLTVRSEREGDNIRVKFIDTGPGIPEEHLGLIFDPFFTTKEGGEGTGLGLSIAYGIMEGHGGRIWAESPSTSLRTGPSTELGRGEVGKGATFVVELPIRKEKVPLVKAHAMEKRRYRRQRILVVDDEEAIIDSLTRLLKADGHKVEGAMDGDTALRKIGKKRYDVIISDLKMPGMSGQRLYKHIKEREPDLAPCLIFITGDTVSPASHAFLEETGNSYVCKPFEVDELRRAIEKALAPRGE